MFNQTVILITSCWLITNALIMKTKTISSSLVFKVIPFGLGICCLYIAAKMFRWI